MEKFQEIGISPYGHVDPQIYISPSFKALCSWMSQFSRSKTCYSTIFRFQHGKQPNCRKWEREKNGFQTFHWRFFSCSMMSTISGSTSEMSEFSCFGHYFTQLAAFQRFITFYSMWISGEIAPLSECYTVCAFYIGYGPGMYRYKYGIKIPSKYQSHLLWGFQLLISHHYLEIYYLELQSVIPC